MPWLQDVIPVRQIGAYVRVDRSSSDAGTVQHPIELHVAVGSERLGDAFRLSLRVAGTARADWFGESRGLSSDPAASGGAESWRRSGGVVGLTPLSKLN